MKTGSIENKVASAILSMIRARRTSSSTPEDDSHAPSSPAIAPAKLREARFSDFHAVAALKQRWRLNADSYENWQRLWQHNPALMPTQIERPMTDRPIGWVLEANGAVVGYLGNISLLYRFGNKTLTAVTAHGLVVDPPYRAVGLTLVAAFFRQKSVDLFISTTAIEAVGKIALAFKSSPLPQPDYDTVLFWVLQPYGFACALMNKLKLAPILSHIGAGGTALALGADKIVRRRYCRRSSRSFTVKEISIDEIGDEFQSLWTEKQSEGCRLLADRSPATLRWHFNIPGDRGSARVLCCYKQAELVGYAIVRNDTNQENGSRTSIIADLVARQDDPAVVKALWAAAYNYAKQAGSHVLELLGFPTSIREAAAEWNPYSRKYPACPFYYKAADPELHGTLADGAAWYASPYDGDATLIRPSYATPAQLDTSPIKMQDTADKIVRETLNQQHAEVS
jgi:hypothetical protein